jgi:hypothetical protein
MVGNPIQEKEAVEAVLNKTKDLPSLGALVLEAPSLEAKLLLLERQVRLLELSTLLLQLSTFL